MPASTPLATRVPAASVTSAVSFSNSEPSPNGLRLSRRRDAVAGIGTRSRRTSLGSPRSRATIFAVRNPGTSHSHRLADKAPSSGSGTDSVTPSSGLVGSNT